VAERSESERNAILDHLEQRRAGLDVAMWQAPALTFAAQAFLLQVLTNENVHWVARIFILAAGVASSVAALASLIRGRAREVLYSDALASYFEAFGLPDTRPARLPRKPLEREGKWHDRDARIQAWSERRPVPMYLLWSAALALFAVADVVAFALTV